MKRRTSSNQGTKVKIEMDAEPDAWSVNRTLQIIIKDETYRDVITWRLVPKSFLPKVGLDGIIDGTNSKSEVFVLRVEPEDTIATVKAYIQEEKGISIKKQKLLNLEGGVLGDAHTLNSLGIKDNSVIILRYAPITRIYVNSFYGRLFNLMVESDDTTADVKALIHAKEGIRPHKQMLYYDGRRLLDDVRLVDVDIEYDSVLDLNLEQCGC